jgi:N-acetylglucosaminyldiphosphoundecaprenol N-acetyl-beta-D-mannosaminyltransferase
MTLFLLGGSMGVADTAAQRLKERYPQLQIVGTMHGFFNKGKPHDENREVIRMINQANPDLLLVGMGMPLQEQWLMENWHELNPRVAITCGALFEYISGDLRRGPQWMTDNYLEWLARMIISPKRYTKRYLRDNPLFLYRVLKQKIGQNKS